MIPARQAPLALGAASRCGTVLTHRCQRQRRLQSAAASPSWGDKPPPAVDHAPDNELLQLEDEYSTLKVNWFPGHMVKATKVIREKLKQVDMVFEVRDARLPFTSANDDLDKIVGPSKARLIVLNKADLSNQALEQRVLQRFREQGKTAVYACGRTGTNVHKLLAWARERGARRGGFSTTGAVAMVVGMPNVGKSSLINLLRGKGSSRGKGPGRGRGGGGGDGEGAKQVARVGAMPGVTRQVSAFRIGSTPPLYLVDTPGVMVPRVERVTAGLFLALTRAVPDSAVPPDILVGFMLRIVRSRRLAGAGAQKPPRGSSGSRSSSAKGDASTVRDTASRPRQQHQPRRSKAIAAWLSSQEEAGAARPAGTPSFGRRYGDGGDVTEETKAEADDGRVERSSSRRQRDGGGEGGGLPMDAREARRAKEQEQEQEEQEEEEHDEMEALLEAVERESGAEGKPAPEARRICCRFLLDAFRDGQFGTITLDSVPRVRRRGHKAKDYSSPGYCSPRECRSQAGWASRSAAGRGEEVGAGSGEDSARVAAGGGGGGGRRGAARQRDGGRRPASADSGLAERLVRDWSSADAWERPGAGGRRA